MKEGMIAAYQQSKTTHGGEEAAELCRLLTFLCISFINGAGKELLEDLSTFKSPLYTVTCLANGRCEQEHPENAHPKIGGLDCRQWDWRSPHHRFCKSRAAESPGYIGSYAMDCMSMALHCVYTTQNFEEATLKAANLRGDSDSVCAVVGQLAGSLYGASAIPSSWLKRIRQWDGGSIAARALMLHDHEALGRKTAISDDACASAMLLGTSYS
jgi:ADP-ribosylglycohydrolase